MSNGIYDILGKLNGLKPKDNPVSMSAEPVYESIDPQDITPAVDSLEEKYQNFLAEETAKRSQQKDAEISRGEPEIVKLLNKARLERPSAASDTEALAYQMVKANKELEKANAANDEQETKIADLQAKVSASPTAKSAPAVQPTPAPVAQPTAAAPTTAPAARPSATILRMPTPATAEVPAQAPATAKVPVQTTAQDKVPADTAQTKDTKDTGDTAKTQGDPGIDITKGTTTGPAANDDEFNLSAFGPNVSVLDTTKNQKKVSTKAQNKSNVTSISPQYELPLLKRAGEKLKEGYYKKQNIKNEEQASLDLVNIPPSPVLTTKKDYVNYNNEKLEAMLRDPALTSVALIYPGTANNYSTINLTRPMFDKLKSALASIKNPEMHRNVSIDVLSNRETASRYLTSAQGDKELHFFYDVKSNEAGKAFNLGLKANPQGRWYAVGQENPNATKTFGKPKTLWVSPPRGKLAGTQQENLGNDTMQENVKTSSILKAVHQVEDKKLRESAKPDFLDLDKDGDTDEPMKSAAKSAKDHEPAEVDSDAVAKRKRLQALKDKQEDERAEKGDDYKSASRFVKGRAYGGAAQKDDEDKDLDESGLQAYLGKKKYGKEGMKALQQAGREGASKEKMAMLRAKHDKMDEARPSRADKVTKDLTSIADKKGYKSAKDFTRQDWDKVAKPHGYTGKEIAAVRGHKVEEVAPPGAKAERMVKHIKKGYAKDGNLSKREKGIAYATAWKAHNKGQVEEGTNFGDTIKNSEGKMTKVKVTEGKDAIRNHPIYTTKEAWDHYSQELAEQEMMEQSMMEAPVVDVQQELDEIAKLAGLAPKMEAKSVCPSCKCEKCECNENLDPMVPADSVSPLTHTLEGMGCTMEELEEAASRKDFRRVADRIANMKDRDEAAKLGHAFADDFEKANPRFKRKMFLTACGLDEAACNMRPGPATIMVGEEAMDEGNEFTKARLDAIAQGKDTFSVSGKTYNVSGDTSDEKTQVESVNEDINVNITANGEQDALNLLRKLSGMAEVPQVTGIAIPMGDESATCGACGSSPCGCEESVEEERDIELANTPHETVAPINAVTTDAGGGLGGVKKQYPLAANRGANPLEEEKLWTAYENMINDVKA
jgi:hypothetical protein